MKIKLKVIERLKTGVFQRKVAEEFGISKSQVQLFGKKNEEILNAVCIMKNYNFR